MNVVITGSTRGIGLGIAREFLNQGHNVLINGRSRESTAAVVQQLQHVFPDSEVYGYAANVSNYAEVERMADYASKVFTIDIWINNAGIDQNREYIWEHDPLKMGQIVDVNIKGVLNGTRIASALMKATGGFIYNMEGFGSDGRMMRKMSIYGMTKRATSYYTMAAAQEAAGTKLKVGILSPGMVLTDFMIKSLPEDTRARERYLKIYHILGDTVEDVAGYLVEKMIQNKRNGAKIVWLTKRKTFLRFLKQVFKKRMLEGLE